MYDQELTDGDAQGEVDFDLNNDENLEYPSEDQSQSLSQGQQRREVDEDDDDGLEIIGQPSVQERLFSVSQELRRAQRRDHNQFLDREDMEEQALGGMKRMQQQQQKQKPRHSHSRSRSRSQSQSQAPSTFMGTGTGTGGSFLQDFEFGLDDPFIAH